MRKKLIRGLTALLALVFVFAGIMIYRDLSARQEQIRDFNELAALVEQNPSPKPAEAPLVSEEPAEEQPAVQTQPVSTGRNLEPLFAKNPDCIGWLFVEGTQINYPLMHTPDDPERYLKKNFEQAYSAAGVPFLEGICSMTCDNLILYGHNMKNGTMFADVTRYTDADYGYLHPEIQLETGEGLRRYTVFAVVQLKDSDDWYGFHHAADAEEYNTMVADIKSRALYDMGITPQYGQQLVTLSTCYGSGKRDRIIVVGVECE